MHWGNNQWSKKACLRFENSSRAIKRYIYHALFDDQNNRCVFICYRKFLIEGYEQEKIKLINFIDGGGVGYMYHKTEERFE